MNAGAIAGTGRPAVGDELVLRIASLAFGGDGVARTDAGYVVFVAGGFPGDLVRARVHDRKRSHAHARVSELIEAGPDRVPPLADHPGAPWQVLRYERQLEVKQAQVDDALRRIGGLDGFALDPIVAAVERWRYRNKLEYSFGRAAGGALVCGFHAPGSWERIEPLEDCLLASERGNEARREVLAWCRSRGLEPLDRRTGEGFLRNLVVREGRRTGELQVRLVTSPGELDGDSLAAAVRCDGLLWTQSGQRGETTAGGTTELLAGSAMLSERLGELEFLLAPESFFQTNTEMAEVLYRHAAAAADLHGWERVFDLYCGVGSIGLTLARHAGSVIGLELVADAVANANASAARNEIANASFHAGDVRLALRELVARSGRPDVVVVDPPRAGLSQKVVRRIVEAGPRRIVYVSCNPTTLAPNAAAFAEAGWRLERVTPVDMFPQTPHIECVALLRRAAGRHGGSGATG
jgi:23S rRNA (uracil1939-C5)-methyltransferase